MGVSVAVLGVSGVWEKVATWPMIGHEGFSATNLNPAARTWHARLVGMDVTALAVYNNAYNATNDATGADVIGEALLHTITPLLCAFRVTGDLNILDMIDALMERAKNPLIDLGYFLALDHRSQSGISALVQQMAYCYALNAAKTSPGAIDYSARAGQWASYVDETYMPAVDVFSVDGLPADSLRHFTTAGTRGMLYHFKRTNTAASWLDPGGFQLEWDAGYQGYNVFLQAANRTDIDPEATPANGLLQAGNRKYWDHKTPFPNLAVGSQGWQPTNYAAYTLANLVDIALEGILPYSSAEEMMTYARTAEYVMTDFATTGFIRENVNSETLDETFTVADLTTGNWGVMYGLGRWLSALQTYGDSAWTEVGAGTNVVVPAWMLFATA